jgi:uncharacterized protein (UPF0261 family)
MDYTGNLVGTFYDPESDMAFLEGVRSTLDRGRVRLLELDLHINDEAFSKTAAEVFLSLIKITGDGNPSVDSPLYRT